MSEWYDNQKQSISSIRKLLQEQIEKANPIEAAEQGELDTLIEQQAQFV